jgi:hypothetical protein
MVSPPSENPQAAVSFSAAVRGEILQQLVEIASTVANAQLDGLTNRLVDALLRASESRVNPDDAKLCGNAATLLKKNRYSFFYVVSARLTTLLQQEIQLVEDPSFIRGESDSAPNSLPPDVEIDKKLCLIKLSRLIEKDQAERLTALGVRLAHMLGRDAVTTAQNPFRPQIFLSVIHDAWCEFHPDTSAHHLVFPLLHPHLCLDMAPILHALNAALIKRGIVPTFAKPFQVEIVRPATIEVVAETHPDDAVAQQLRRLFPLQENTPAKTTGHSIEGAFPALFHEEAVQTAAARNALFDYLTGIQLKPRTETRPAIDAVHAPQYTSVTLSDIKQQAPQGMLTPADEATFDLVAKIFETVFSNGNIPAEMKVVIGTLQVPILKAALIDKNFFFREAHPARRTIELLTRLSVAWDKKKGQQDPLNLLIRRNARRIQQEFERITVFSDVVEELESFIKQEEAASAQALSNSITQALRQEKLQQANKAARHEVALRVGTGEVVAFVETFLEDKWVSVLTLAYSVKDEKPQVASNAIATMDELCWSVKPKITMDERKQLLAKLPSMLAMLNKWLDLIKWNDAERVKFFAELAQCHASIVRAPLELSPERQMQIALQVAQKAAERRLQRQAAQAPEVEPDVFDEQVRTLKCGTWMTFRSKDGVDMKIKLAWVSPMRSFYLFSNRERQEALTISHEELAQALREARARIVLVAGFVDRALATALGVDGANADHIDAASAA